MRIVNEIGNRYGRLLVLKKVPNPVSTAAYWECQCECGALAYVTGNALRSGRTQSCGCYKVDYNTTHGMTDTPEFKVWKSARGRCTDKNNPSYGRYGARGITVDPSWDSFEQFYADMGPRPFPVATIERIDNDGPYCKANCRWATKKEQARNRRNNRPMTIDGVTKPISAWCEEYGLARDTVGYRLNKLGWDIKRAVTTPLLRQRTHSGDSCRAQEMQA
jgi:hypothetical protein